MSVLVEGVSLSIMGLPERGLGLNGLNHIFVNGVRGSSHGNDGANYDELEH